MVYGPYWLHLKEAWKHRDQPNLHFMFYEDLKENNIEELKRLDRFLGTNLSQEQLQNVRTGTLILNSLTFLTHLPYNWTVKGTDVSLL